MKRYLLLFSLAIGCMTVNAAVPRRPMLEQGKTWTYIYHHFEDGETPDPDGAYKGHEVFFSQYTLKGDTIINDLQYMKMYRNDDVRNKKTYYGAYREDEEGRVYVAEYKGQKDFKLIDFNMTAQDVNNSSPEPYVYPESVIVETIKADGQFFRRYRYDGSGAIGIEGVGYKGDGLLTYAFEEKLPCICDYEELYAVSGNNFYFSASDFEAPKVIELAEGEQELINSNNDFAFNLFRKARGDKSKILSPLSITFALGLLNNGADGLTQKEINQTLGFDLPPLSPTDNSPQAGKQSADAINAFCQKMLKEANTLDNKTKALIANTIFVNEGLGYRLQDGFIDKANTYYHAEPQNRDFNDGETMNVINQWASDHTMGMIPEVLNEETFDPWFVSYLLNALYFKGTWSSPFNPELTQQENFGGGPEVPMMRNHFEYLDYTENDLYQAVKLPYGNGAYQMTVFLPREDKTVGEVLETLNGSNWQPLFMKKEVDLKLPRFETDTNQPLEEIMKDLGMPTAFTKDAEFPYFCNVPIYIGKMFQVAKIKLDEEGTEAAAVTVIAIDAESLPPMPKLFHANRPFLYIISERSTGTIFFIGQYAGGVSADTRTGIVATKYDAKTTSQDQIFNLAGQRLSKEPTRGIYIKNGKVLVR